MIKAKYSNNVGIDYFYEKFKKGKHFFPKHFFFGLKTLKKKVPVDEKLHMRIVKTYLDIYFKDFYKSKEPFYFPLSGEIVKVKGANFLRKKSESVVTDVINWVWYLRPAFNYFSNIKIIKLRGNSKITSLEKQYKEDNKDKIKQKSKDYSNETIQEY